MVYSPSSLLNPVNDYGRFPIIGQPFLYIVRHVQNDDDNKQLIRGLKDQPINEAGEGQLEEVRDFFKARLISAVITDDLSRTRATAMAIASVTHCDVETDLGLRSWDLGKLEGKAIAAHKLEIQDFKTHKDKVPVGGQSWAEFERDANAATDRIVHEAMQASAPVVIVTHGSFLQVFFSRYGDWEDTAEYDHSPLEQAGIAALYVTRDGSELRVLTGEKQDIDD